MSAFERSSGAGVLACTIFERTLAAAESPASPSAGRDACSTASRLAALRELLAEKFPSAERKPGGILRTGIAPIDAIEGGLRRAAVTELAGSSGNGALFLHALLGTLVREKWLAALVDAGRTFDPEGCAPEALARLLVVFCENAVRAIKAADLLLRDGNLAIILLDLQAAPAKDLRRIPASTWHRFQRLAEQTTAAFVVLTPQPMVEAAQVRIVPDGKWTLAAQRRWRHELIAAWPARVFRRHVAAAPSPREGCEFISA
jgi:hypothetical protein